MARITATYYPIDGSVPLVLAYNAVPAGRSVTFWGVSNNPRSGGMILVSGTPKTLEGTYGSVVIESDNPIAVMANESMYGPNAAEADSKNYEGFNVDR